LFGGLAAVVDDHGEWLDEDSNISWEAMHFQFRPTGEHLSSDVADRVAAKVYDTALEPLRKAGEPRALLEEKVAALGFSKAKFVDEHNMSPIAKIIHERLTKVGEIEDVQMVKRDGLKFGMDLGAPGLVSPHGRVLQARKMAKGVTKKAFAAVVNEAKKGGKKLDADTLVGVLETFHPHGVHQWRSMSLAHRKLYDMEKDLLPVMQGTLQGASVGEKREVTLNDKTTLTFRLCHIDDYYN